MTKLYAIVWAIAIMSGVWWAASSIDTNKNNNKDIVYNVYKDEKLIATHLSGKEQVIKIEETPNFVSITFKYDKNVKIVYGDMIFTGKKEVE